MIVLVFAWSDLNDDGRIDAGEVTFRKGDVASVTWLPDLSVVTASALVFKPAKITAKGAPVFDAAQATAQPVEWQFRVSTGGGQALMGAEMGGWC